MSAGFALYECRGGVLIFWHLFWCRCKRILFKMIVKVVLIIKC